MTADVFSIAAHRGRHNQAGYFALADLPQRPSIEANAISTEWWELDQIFRMYRGQFVVVTGVAGHGKSTFLMNILCNVAKKKDLRSFLYVPENEQHLAEKLRRIWSDDATYERFTSRQCFVQSATPDEFDERPKTLPWVLEMAEKAIEIDGIDIVVIDPWNELERAKPKDQLLSDYIGECLMLVKQFCRIYKVIVFMVAHPTKAVNEGGGRVPTLADIEGSMNWYNKCDNGLIVVRDVGKNTARVISAKAREIGSGKPGVCYFHVDENTGIFTPQYGAVT
jgi:twinkle protein